MSVSRNGPGRYHMDELEYLMERFLAVGSPEKFEDKHNMETRLQEVEPQMADDSNNVTYKVNPEMESTNREIFLETGVGEDGPQPTNSSASESANSTISSEATIMNCGWTAVGVVFLGICCSYF